MKTNTKFWITGILVLIIIISFGLFKNSTHTSAGTIKIGGAFPLSGDASTVSWGEAARNGAELAIEEINARGGIHGQKMELVVEDMQSSSKGSVSAVTKLMNVDKVNALLVSWLDVYQGAASLAVTHNIPIISPDGGIEAINGETVNKDVFSTWYRTDVKTEKVVKYMAEHGVKTLGIIVQNDSYYSDLLTRVVKYSAKYGIKVVATEKLDEGVSDIRTQALKVSSTHPDTILFALYDDKQLYNFLTLHSQRFANIPLFGDELVEDHFRAEKFAGLYENVTYFHASLPASDFVAKYHAKFGVDPVFGAGPAYDAVMIFAKTFEEKGVGADANTYLRNTTFDTVSYGKMTFDEIGGVKTSNNQFDMWKIGSGKAVKVE